MDQKKDTQQLLDELYAPYKKCIQCPLGTLGRKKIVFGEGSPNADLMIICEGSGKDEDEKGRPFVGRSGKRLTRVLENLDIKREDIFLTNIVKCRPPNNRQPLPIETKTCKELLLVNQIKIIRPKVICTLGSSAIQSLINQKVKITQTRGKKLDYNGIVVIPTYHPAYVLRNPKELKTLQKDIQLAYSHLK